jgi:hypothetical protein
MLLFPYGRVGESSLPSQLHPSLRIAQSTMHRLDSLHARGGSIRGSSAEGGPKELGLKEKAILELVNTLSDKLRNLRVKSKERYLACCAELEPGHNEERDVPGRIERDTGDSLMTGVNTSRQQSLTLLFGRGGITEPSLAFRHSPTTDAGRRLETRFEIEMPFPSRTATSSLRKSATSRGKTQPQWQQAESRKVERAKYERALQSNLDCFITRSVTDLEYAIAAEGTTSGEEGDESLGSSESHDDEDDEDELSQPGSQLGVGKNGSQGLSHCAERKLFRRETFPIPISAKEMNPGLLLGYACNRAVLPGGQKLFRHVLSLQSRMLFVYLFWYIHCRFFQKNSAAEQSHLLKIISDRYVRLLALSASSMEKEFQDVFFLHYPYILAHSVYWGFYYLCPGTRHLYSSSFKRILYLETVRLMSGVEVTPIAILRRTAVLFPGDAGEEASLSLINSLPPITKSSKAGAAALQAEQEGGEHKASCRQAAADPLAGFVGDRNNLKFREPVPRGLQWPLQRQTRKVFDAAATSPLLQSYLEEALPAHEAHSTRKPENMARTVPVGWCVTGGTETFHHRSVDSKEYDAALAQRGDAKLNFAACLVEDRKAVSLAVARLERQKQKMKTAGRRLNAIKSARLVSKHCPPE